MKKAVSYVALLLSVFLSACSGPQFKNPVVDGKKFSVSTIKANGDNGRIIISRKDIERGVYVIATTDRYSKTANTILTDIIRARLETNGLKVVSKVEDAAMVIKFVPIGLPKPVNNDDEAMRYAARALGFALGGVGALGSSGRNNPYTLSLVGFVDSQPKDDPMSAEFINGFQQRARLDTDYSAENDGEAAQSIKAMVDLWVEAYIKG